MSTMQIKTGSSAGWSMVQVTVSLIYLALALPYSATDHAIHSTAHFITLHRYMQ